MEPMKTTIHHTPNTGPKIEQIWAFISRDRNGKENVIGGHVGVLGLTPLMTGNPRTFEVFRSIVEPVREELEAAGQTVHLIRFTIREEIVEW